VEFQLLTAEVLIDRLIARHNHLLALRICKYLNMKTERVLVHWACEKVRSRDQEDVVIKDVIVNQLKSSTAVSYAEIASTAHKVGKPVLERCYYTMNRELLIKFHYY